MLSLFASPYCAPAAPEPRFTTLFRLLEDFDEYSRDVQPQQQQQQMVQQSRHPRKVRRTIATFKPKFDVRETEQTYELHGDLPGIDKNNLNIEFSDAQTMVVRGRVERTYESKPEAEDVAATPSPAAAAEEKASDADETASNASSHGWHHATVEDDPEEPATPPGAATPTESESTVHKSEVASSEKTSTAVEKAAQPSAPATAPKTKFWLYERSIGEFSRSFVFPTRVEHDKVSAVLENGVLNISVPKAPKHQSRRITIN